MVWSVFVMPTAAFLIPAQTENALGGPSIGDREANCGPYAQPAPLSNKRTAQRHRHRGGGSKCAKNKTSLESAGASIPPTT